MCASASCAGSDRIGHARDQPYLVVVDDLDPLDPGVVGLRRRNDRRIVHRVVEELHRLRVERLAVLEFHALAQRQLPGERRRCSSSSWPATVQARPAPSSAAAYRRCDPSSVRSGTMTSTSSAFMPVTSAPPATTTRSCARAASPRPRNAQTATARQIDSRQIECSTRLSIPCSFVAGFPVAVVKLSQFNPGRISTARVQALLHVSMPAVRVKREPRARDLQETDREQAGRQCQSREIPLLRLSRPQRQGDRHAQRQHLLFRRIGHAGIRDRRS